MIKITSFDLQGSNFTLLVISVNTICMKTIRLSLEKKIQESPYFFSKNTPIVINVSTINSDCDWTNLYNTISDVGLFIVGVCCCYNNKLKNIITQSGIPILVKGHNTKYFNYEKNYYSQCSSYKKNNFSKILKTQIINVPIRSGQKIYARNRDLIIISNVSSGAEVIADGNIHIYGLTKGRILAGANGNEEAQIFCSNVFPELISIGGYYWLIDQIPKEFLRKSVRFYLKNKTIFIQKI